MNYFVGLDIGTESVGWAVTDEGYAILKKNGHALWGVRQFPEAKKAEERRLYRVARRRLQRREQRLAMLRDIFAPEIAQVDPAFFQRMEESKFLESDKRSFGTSSLGRYTLFSDQRYCDRDYHREFPSIYHLRKALILEDRDFDIRLVYLAVHHILKKRGHFLFGDMSLDNVNFANCMEPLRTYLLDEYDLAFEPKEVKNFEAVLMDHTMSTAFKRKALAEAMGTAAENRQVAAILDLLTGKKVKASRLCAMDVGADKSFSFKEGFESAEAELADLLGDAMSLIYHIKRLYDWSILCELKSGEDFLSCAKVKVYERHNQDLTRLKTLLRSFPKVYREVFRASKEKLDNYVAYSGHGAKNYRCAYKPFSVYLKRQIEDLKKKMDGDTWKEASRILAELENGIFLPKQTTTDNSIIPHQLHEQELKKILERASAYLPFLNAADESGLSAKERILALFRFRIPYYIGPLDTRSEHSWVVRSMDKIYPWNFDRVVDHAQSAQRFIERMTKKCSYIDQPVLPRGSLLYSRFSALNMLNKLRINDQPISVETKQRIYNELLLNRACTNIKALSDYLLSNGLMQKGDELGCMDEQFRILMPGYYVFHKILQRGNGEDMVEDIIRHMALFGADRKLLAQWLADEYGERLSEEDRAYLLRNRDKFKEWGNLSRAFLKEILHRDPQTGELISIDDALWRTNYNLMELLSSQFGFVDALEIYRAEHLGMQSRTLDEILEDSYASPGIRRAIHQSLGIISELEKIMKGQPKRVFVEVTRSEGPKVRTQSRKKCLQELYKSCKAEAADIYQQLEAYDEAQLRSDKLYLYFIQQGKCMYSGQAIDLARIASDYDIDHIYPQSLVKDDSLENRVLVKRELNDAKADRYPIGEGIRTQMRAFWADLRKRGFIGEEKYRRLTRNTPFTDSERAGFIARQLVETGQAAKIVADLLKRRYGDNRVVYVKAGNVAAFRQAQRLLPDGTQCSEGACKGVQTQQDPLFVKCRQVNDFHHAKDAYLNIVVGNVYHLKFTSNPLFFVRTAERYSMNRVFDGNVVRGGETAWKAGEEGSIGTVRRMMRKNNILVTRFAREVTGGLFDQLIVSSQKGSNLAPIKQSDLRMRVEVYGGYNKLSGAYFMLVEHGKQTKRRRSLEPVYIMHKALYEREPLRYCEEILGLQAPRVLIPKIKIDALLSLDGFRMNISGRTGDRIAYKNANQLVISAEQAQYVKRIGKYLERCSKERNALEITIFDGIDAQRNDALYRVLAEKLGRAPYKVMYERASQTLNNYAASFKKLGLYEQCQALMAILGLFSTSVSNPSLKIDDKHKCTGLLLTSKNLNNYAGRSLLLIHPSITGVFEQKIDLLGDVF